MYICGSFARAVAKMWSHQGVVELGPGGDFPDFPNPPLCPCAGCRGPMAPALRHGGEFHLGSQPFAGSDMCHFYHIVGRRRFLEPEQPWGFCAWPRRIAPEMVNRSCGRTAGRCGLRPLRVTIRPGLGRRDPRPGRPSWRSSALKRLRSPWVGAGPSIHCAYFFRTITLRRAAPVLVSAIASLI